MTRWLSAPPANIHDTAVYTARLHREKERGGGRMASIDGVKYTVRSGDSLWSIAHSHYGHGAAWPAIFAYNQQGTVRAQLRTRLRHPDELAVGQTIYLPRRMYVRHLKRQPGQRHTPGRIRPTQPARAAGLPGAAAPVGHPPPPSGLRPPASPGAPGRPGARQQDPAPTTSPTPHNGDSGQTPVNPFGVKIDTSQHRRFKTSFVVGPFIVEVEFKGTVVVRHDTTMPVATFSKDTFEYTYKNEMLNAAGALTAVTKLQVDWKKKSGSAELMFTTNLIAGKTLPISLGPLIDEKGPALRGKVDFKGVHGKVHDILYFVQDDETLTIQVTVRLKPGKPKEPPTEPPPGVHVLVPAGIPAPAPAPAPVPGYPPLVPPLAGPDVLPVPAPPAFPGPDVLPVPPPPHPNQDLQPTTSPTPTRAQSESVLMQAGKLIHDHPVAAAVVGVAVVGLVIVALPEEAVAGAVSGTMAVGRWLVLRMLPAAAMSAAGA